ncbi:MAG TPA: DUF4838 domain-containing protein, partial [Pirellulales bacterium]
GQCQAAGAAKIDPSDLPGNGYIVKTVGENLFIAGNDSRGDPLDLDTHEGTLFGVYDLLESQLQVRWLWPGTLGEVIPHRENVTFDVPNATVEPLLWFKQWRGGHSEGEKVWLKRQRFGRSVQPKYGHSFGDYWARFNQTHPEYFSMMPDGTRRIDPDAEGDTQYVHMCVTEPGLVAQIIADWKARGAGEYLNVCENDGWAGCACERCLAADEPDPENPVPFTKRLESARSVFDGHDGPRGLWALKLGSLSDRYAKFWHAVAEQAASINPHVKVVSYVYDNYRKPPVAPITLGPNVLCGLVPQESIFGYDHDDSAAFRKDWSGWEKTGCSLFLRPNYTLQAPNFPAFYAHTLGDDLKFALAHGLKGTDFDSLTSKYAVQGPSLYMLATVLNHPDASVDGVIDEFSAAFGPAKVAVKKYFDLCEQAYPQYRADEKANRIKAKRKYHAGQYGPYYLLGGQIFNPEVMTKLAGALDQAEVQAQPDGTAAARVQWLKKGLTHARLILATQKAFEHQIDTGDATEFTQAHLALNDFRNANAEYDKINFAGLSGDEKMWTRGNR